MDSKYSFEQAYAVYNAYKDSSVEDELYNKLKQLSFGRFTGNNSIGGTSGIHVDGELNFYGGMIIGNHTTSTVGGMIVNKNAVLNFYDGLIIGNKGSMVGGIYSQDCKQMNIFNGIIACNENLVPNANLVAHAGGIAFDGTNSDFNIYGGIISNNKSAARAGGVMVKAAKVFQFVGGEIVNNHSTLYGGGIYVYKTKYALLQNAKISNNISDGSTGGAHLNMIEKASLHNMEITNNQATGQGGAVFIDGNISNIEMDNTRIANNMALDGSGIYILNGQVQLKNTFVVDNESTSTNSVGAITLNKDAGNIFVKCGVVIANNIDGNNKGAD
ncbi:MAG: hypothetical protein K2L47_03165, partial [Clostridia bacterium]|nr:hypothetical protein [Clostridia bacterium]